MDELLRYYFQKCFSYKNMLLFLSKYHDIEMSMRSLQQRLHDMGLKRRRLRIDISMSWYFCALENIFVHWKIYLCTEKYICALKHTCALENIFVHWKIYLCTEKYTCALKNIFVHWKIYLCTEKYICALRNMPVY